VDGGQREVALAVLRPADAAGEVVAGAQVEAADLAGADVDVVGAGQVAGLGRAQEAEAVRQDLQHAVGDHAFAVAGQYLEQVEDHVLLAGARHALVDLQLLGDIHQLVRRHALEVAQGVLREAFGHVRGRQALALVVAVLGQAVVASAAAAVAAVAEAVAPAALLAATAATATAVALVALLLRLLFALLFLAAVAAAVAVGGRGGGVAARLGRGRGGGFGRG